MGPAGPGGPPECPAPSGPQARRAGFSQGRDFGLVPSPVGPSRYSALLGLGPRPTWHSDATGKFVLVNATVILAASPSQSDSESDTVTVLELARVTPSEAPGQAPTRPPGPGPQAAAAVAPAGQPPGPGGPVDSDGPTGP
jgi:hypothetical protein